MKKNNDIPKGYQLHFTTWENDGDFYRTDIISGLEKDDVKFYIDLLQHFKCKHDRKNDNDTFYGNGSTDMKELRKIIDELLKKYNVSENIRKEWDSRQDPDFCGDQDDWLWEVLCDNLNIAYQEEYPDEIYMSRVFDKAEVFFVPKEIKDVTKEFVK